MTEADLRTILKPLFAQFATADGDMEAKLMGYVIALARTTPEALQAAVRMYLSGEVAEHDGKFLPTSAELARVVRKEQAHLDRISPRLQLVDKSDPEPEKRVSAERWQQLSDLIGETAAVADWEAQR